MTDQSTIVHIFSQRVETDGDRPALFWRRDGEYQSIGWNEIARQVRQTATFLVRLGVEPGDRVIHVSENRLEWIITDLAIQIAQAIHVPVHAPLTGEQIAYQIIDSGANVVLLSTAEQAEKLVAHGQQIPEHVQFFSYEPTQAIIGAAPLTLLGDLVAKMDEAEGAEVQQRALENLTPDSLATILYTSGTTGEPKGVMLNQHNLTSNAIGALTSFGGDSSDLRLTFLPLSHIFARTCDLYTWIVQGCQLALAQSRDTVLADCAAIRPTLINGVPYFYDKLMRHLTEQKQADKPGALRELLGGRMKSCCSGGAALPVHLFDFFAKQELPLLQGYGLTESSPVITASSLSRNKRGSAGPPIPEVEVKIAEDGEILTRGPHVMVGYYKNQKATDEVIKDGWLSTGDLGELDENGFLTITGRKKEILVTSGGKNIAPVYLESLLTEDPLILQALVIGDDRKFLSALIVPDLQKLHEEIAQRKIVLDSSESALTHSDVLALVQDRIEQRLSSVSYYEQVRKITLLEHGFSIESGEMTPKMSLRRNAIEANRASQIEAMYQK